MFLSIIVPLYNEEKTIVNVLDRLQKVQYPSSLVNYEIIVVNDASTDRSAEVVGNYISTHSHIRLVEHTKNQGKGAGVRTGIAAAKGDVFLIQDADLELSPDDIPALIDCMNTLNVQFVNGSRYMDGILRPLASYQRYLGNKVFTILTSILVNVRLTDVACGYKLIKKELYEQIQLKENRFGFEAELIVKALKIKRNNIAEVPVHYFPRSKEEGKKLATSDAFKILWVIIKYSFFKTKAPKSN